MKPAWKNQIEGGLGAKFEPNHVQCCEKSKKQAISLGFFHILLRDDLLKQESLVVKPPEWTFMAIIARNSKL